MIFAIEEGCCLIENNIAIFSGIFGERVEIDIKNSDGSFIDITATKTIISLHPNQKSIIYLTLHTSKGGFYNVGNTNRNIKFLKMMDWSIVGD